MRIKRVCFFIFVMLNLQATCPFAELARQAGASRGKCAKHEILRFAQDDILIFNSGRFCY